MPFRRILCMNTILGRQILQTQKNQILSMLIGILLQEYIYPIVQLCFVKVKVHNVRWTLLLQCFKASLQSSKEQQTHQVGHLGHPVFPIRIPITAQNSLPKTRSLIPINITVYTIITARGLLAVPIIPEVFSQLLGLFQDLVMAIIFMRMCALLDSITNKLRRSLADVHTCFRLFSTYLQSAMEQGHGPQNGMFNLPALISSILGNGAHGDAVYTDEALDRIITQMMEQHNANGAPGPASAAAIAALPKQKADKSMMGHDGKAECSVCMDAVEIGDEITVLPCKHWFHGECVGAWLKEHDTCPHCRQGIMPKDAPAQTDAPHSPDEEPPNHRPPFPPPDFYTTPPQFPGHPSPTPVGIPPQMRPHNPPHMMGAFTQPVLPSTQQQPYIPGGFHRQYPDPPHLATPPGPERSDFSFSAPSHSRSGPPSPRHHHSVHRRRSSARERSSGNGEGSTGSGSGSGGQGVTGWFRRLGGSNDR